VQTPGELRRDAGSERRDLDAQRGQLVEPRAQLGREGVALGRAHLLELRQRGIERGEHGRILLGTLGRDDDAWLGEHERELRWRRSEPAGELGEHAMRALGGHRVDGHRRRRSLPTDVDRDGDGAALDHRTHPCRDRLFEGGR
jgi:hypothetical protein